MAEAPGKTIEKGGKPVLTRRDFLRLMGLLGIKFLTSCSSADRLQTASSHEPEKEKNEETAEFSQWIKEGRNIRTEEDIKMLNNTPLGIDLTYYQNPTVGKIRAISEFPNRIGYTIGYLDVKGSRRYSWKDPEGKIVYACNIYALDFLRLLLGTPFD